MGRLWNAEPGNLLHEWGDKADFPPQLLDRASEDCDLALSADGKIVAWADGQTVRLREVLTGKDLAPPVGHRAAVSAVGISSDSKTLVSQGEDDTLRRWDLTTGNQVAQCPEPTGTIIAAIAPDALSVALANSDGTIRLVEMATGKELRRFTGHTRSNPDQYNDTTDLVFSPNGKILASQGSFDCLIRLHDACHGGELTRSICYGQTSSTQMRPSRLRAFRNWRRPRRIPCHSWVAI